MSRRSRASATLLAASLFAAALLCVAWAPASASGKKLRERAQAALRAGDYEEAEKLYREMVSKDARDPDARLGLSHALLKRRKNQDAFDQAARVLSLEPLSARAHALLGAALLNAGDFRLSVEEFRTALGFNGDEAIAVGGLAMVDFYEGRGQQSLAGLRRAAFIDPNEPDYLYNLGQVAARYEHYKEAANAYEQFLRVAPRTDADRRARIRGLIDFLRYLGAQGNLLNASGPGRVEVPFEVVNNRPVLKVRVNGGKDALRFVIDTGAGMCVISSAAADRLGLKAVARGGAARAVGGEGRFDIVYGFLQSLHVGEAKVDRVPVYIREFYNEQEPVDGYIGLSVLSKYLAVIDYGAGALKLLRGEAEKEVPAQVAGAFEFPIRTTSSGFWSAEVNLDGLERPTNFIIDTGASISVVSEALYARGDMERFAQPSRIKVFGAAGLAENIPTLLLPRISLGTYVRRNVYAAVLDMDPINETAGFEQTGIVGGNVLRHYRVTFDFGRGIVRLEPLGKAAPAEDRKAPAAVTSQS
ncbi:MAG TPA: aspartyl protease family protein [Pyrinomonadaceae bacterium]|jgi:pentatricopeptide repeat protein|nr:aspartyl protease family protein [Pyrinomonadaceae bacterium]